MEKDGQTVVSIVIVGCVTAIALASIAAGAMLHDLMTVTAGVTGTVVGGLLAALQTPGSLTKTISTLFPKDKPQ